jgi:hypothetical protein
MNLLDPTLDFKENTDGLLTIKRQEITDDLLDFIRDERHATASMRTRDYHLAASVPTHLVDLWLGQGIPFYEMTAREVVGKLRRDGLEAFIATSKRV